MLAHFIAAIIRVRVTHTPPIAMTPDISLRHLRVFIAVADLGGATRAADFLYRAQSAVTRSIQELEHSLGVLLFERKTSGMVPTVFGYSLLFRARRAAHEFELARHEMSPRPGGDDAAPHAPGYSLLFNEHQLTTFLKLAELQHMPTAAKMLGITQPAVSASIGKLESSLGIALFKRTPKGMHLTEAGEILFFRTKRALAELRHVAAELAALGGTVEGRVIVGVLPLGRSYILPRAIARAIAAHPKLQVSTIEGSFDPLATDLRAGDIDFILGALRPPDYARDLVGEALLSDRMSLFVRRGHPLTFRAGLSIDELMNERWILPSPGTLARKLIDASFLAARVTPPEAAVETSDVSVLRDLLLQSDMVTAISTQLFHYERMSGELQMVDVEFPGTGRLIGITQRVKSHPSPGAVALTDAIREVAAELGPAAGDSIVHQPLSHEIEA
ncbi:MAG: LysR family transcriptional regulator [Noviherbaspirillum sp.]|nr:LysR family transcriptional regulator [Noviherbaspirillum sp.]